MVLKIFKNEEAKKFGVRSDISLYSNLNAERTRFSISFGDIFTFQLVRYLKEKGYPTDPEKLEKELQKNKIKKVFTEQVSPIYKRFEKDTFVVYVPKKTYKLVDIIADNTDQNKTDICEHILHPIGQELLKLYNDTKETKLPEEMEEEIKKTVEEFLH